MCDANLSHKRGRDITGTGIAATGRQGWYEERPGLSLSPKLCVCMFIILHYNVNKANNIVVLCLLTILVREQNY